MSTYKRRVRVAIEKEIEIELMPSVFAGVTEEEFLESFRKSLWQVESIEDVVEYAARMAANHGGGMYDGIGLLDYANSTYPRVPDVKFREIYDDCEEWILPSEELAG